MVCVSYFIFVNNFRMMTLLTKELRSMLSSFAGLIFVIVFLVVVGSLLWWFPGEYNIPESGYASLSSFFSLAPIFFLCLIPALSMRSFSEEKRSNTILLLFSRPVKISSIIIAKIGGVFIVALTTLALTLVYVASIRFLSVSPGLVDNGAVIGSYIGLIFILLCFVAISVFASSLTSSQITAFILALLLSAGMYFGFELFASLVSDGKFQLLIAHFGLLAHVQSIRRGLVEIQDICYLFFVTVLFFYCTVCTLRKIRFSRHLIYWIILAGLLICSFFIHFRIDLTSDHRYTLSDVSKNAVSKVDHPMEITVYLDGPLNPVFLKLKQSVQDLLSDYNSLSEGQIRQIFLQPDLPGNANEKKRLESLGLNGVYVNEKDNKGNLTRRVVYPWALIKYGDKNIPVPLLVQEKGKSGAENLNTSVEVLEYQFTQAICQAIAKHSRKIVFLYGHGEAGGGAIEDAWDLLSRSYQIDAGILSDEIKQLDDYELVVVAGPTEPFSEKEKYILDQYLMYGGKILLFMDGASLIPELLTEAGESPSIMNDVQLTDLLFTYGVRVNPVFLEDVRCVEIPVNTAPENATPAYTAMPWYFSPLLSPAADHSIVKGLSLVLAPYAGSLDSVGVLKNVRRTVLLTGSEYGHEVRVPDMISLSEIERKPDVHYFNRKQAPVAMLLEGSFSSAFSNRMIPEGVKSGDRIFKQESIPTRMAVVASRGVIANDVAVHSEANHDVLPMGYDRFGKELYANRDFVQNLVEYLTDNNGLMELRNKSFALSLSDKNRWIDSRDFLLLLNVVFPPVVFALLFAAFLVYRRKQYFKKGKSIL